MARLARLCIPGWPHLVLQTGHSRQTVFRDDEDRQLFRQLLQQESVAHGAAVHAYALWDNEVRLLVTPSHADTLSRVIQAIGRRYGSYFNRRHKQAGSLWEGRFKATVVEPDRYLLAAMKFTEGFVGAGDAALAATRERWTSAPHHLGSLVDPLVNDHAGYWALGNTPFEREAKYRSVAEHALTSAELAAFVHAITKGWPLGTDSFVSELSGHTLRRLTPLPRGRPAKT